MLKKEEKCHVCGKNTQKWYCKDDGFIWCDGCFALATEFDVLVGQSNQPGWSDCFAQYRYFIEGVEQENKWKI